MGSPPSHPHNPLNPPLSLLRGLNDVITVVFKAVSRFGIKFLTVSVILGMCGENCEIYGEKLVISLSI